MFTFDAHDDHDTMRDDCGEIKNQRKQGAKLF
jgi:hypothetical protein